MNIYDSILSRFRKSRTHVIPTGQGQLFVRQSPFILKTGKWVVIGEGHVGIVNTMTDPHKVGVMLVDNNGENLRQVYVGYGDLTIASMAHIPAKRRPEPDHGASLGYF